jgi:phosphoglycerol transferase MdoB-like AlkP superfamily enzyme
MQVHFHISYCRHLTHPRSFISSAKELGLKSFIISFVLFSFFNAIPFIFLSKVQLSFLLYFFYFISLISFSSIFLPHKLTYSTNNVLFQLEENLFLSVISLWNHFFVKRKEKHINIKNENSHNLFPNYPLLRFTKSFSGEKLFDIKIEKEEKPHVIFLFLESFRAKNIGCLNSKESVTPQFDKLAKEGLLFPNFYSSGVLTDKAIISSLFGIPPIFRASFLSYYTTYPLIGIPHIAQNQGYRSTYIHNGHLSFDRQADFFHNHGFEEVIGYNTIKQAFPNVSSTSWGIHDEYLMKYSVDLLKKNENQPTFLSLFTISNHHPWVIPKDFTKKIPFSVSDPQYKKYLSSFFYSDHCLGLLVDLLKQNKLSEKVLLFIFSDHGQPLGEHNNNYSCQKYLYEENIHIPLLIWGENRITNPKKIDQIGSQVDLLPTLLDIMNWEGVHHSSGNSLLRKQEKKQIFFNNPYENTYLGMRQENYKYIFSPKTGSKYLYDIKEDEQEKNNIVEQEEKIASNLHNTLIKNSNFFTSLYKKKSFAPEEFLTNKKTFIPVKDITDEKILEKLSTITKTTYLDLSNCTRLSDDSISAIASTCLDLVYVNISNCPLISDEALFSIAKNCTKLLTLNISGCPMLTDSGVNAIIKKNPLLESLYAMDISDLSIPIRNKNQLLFVDFTGLTQISEEGLIKLSKTSPSLKHISFNCSKITDKGINSLAKNCSKLQSISLDEGKMIFSNSLHSLFKNNANLFFIALKNFPNATDKVSEYISPAINVIILESMEKITDKFFSPLKNSMFIKIHLENCPNLYGRFLKQLNIESVVEILNCPKITKEIIEDLRRKKIYVMTDLLY